MTIELITGATGAGKTCYAVSMRVVPEARVSVTTEQGSVYERRIVVAGIRGLAVPHERLPHVLTDEKISVKDFQYWNKTDDDGEPVHKRLPGEPPRHDVEACLYNWWLWCQPGDLIVIDECQFLIEKGTLNKSPPYYLEALSIHRHYGVDFLFITQHPDFLHSAVRKLVNPHRHVRSVMGSPFCMVYTWDHASNTERITTAVKSSWRRKGSYYKLYKSSVAHLKPKAAGRGGLVFAGVLACAVAVGAWQFSKRFGSDGQSLAKASASGPVAVPGGAVRVPGASVLAKGDVWRPAERSAIPAGPDRRTADGYRVVGCMAWGDECVCYDERNLRRVFTPQQCREASSGFDGVVGWQETVPPPADVVTKPADAVPIFGGQAGPGGVKPPVSVPGPLGLPTI